MVGSASASSAAELTVTAVAAQAPVNGLATICAASGSAEGWLWRVLRASLALYSDDGFGDFRGVRGVDLGCPEANKPAA
jgi:hypothetical protein